MNHIEQNNPTDPADFLAEWSTRFEGSAWGNVALAVIGLTNYGERPVQSTRLAQILGRDVREAETIAQRWGPPGTRVEDGLISVDPSQAKEAPRRQLWIGHRQFGVTGCAPDAIL